MSTIYINHHELPTKADASKVDASALKGRYAELAENNPWLKYEYTPGVLDRIGTALGLKTNAQKTTEQWTNGAQDYIAQLLQLQGEEAYNSAEAQAQRQRAAGVNPDLTGGISPGEASEYDNQSTTGGETGQTDIDKIGEATKTIGTIVQTGFSVLSAINTGLDAGIKAVSMIKEAQEIGKYADEIADAWYEQGIRPDGSLNIPLIGQIGQETIREWGKEGWVSSMYDENPKGELPPAFITTGKELTWKEFNNNPYVRAHLKTTQMRRRAWQRIASNYGSYRSGLPAQKKDIDWYKGEEAIGKITAQGENREEIRRLYNDITKAEVEIKGMMQKAQKDYWEAFNKGGTRKVENEDGSVTEIHELTGGEMQGKLARSQATAEQVIADLQVGISDQVQQLISTWIQQASEASTQAEKMFWITISTKIMNAYMSASKGNGGSPGIMKDILNGLNETNTETGGYRDTITF